MVRRRRNAGCFNTASYNGTVTQQALCNCTLADTGVLSSVSFLLALPARGGLLGVLARSSPLPRLQSCPASAAHAAYACTRTACCSRVSLLTSPVHCQPHSTCTLTAECEFGYERNGTACAKMPDISSTTCPASRRMAPPGTARDCALVEQFGWAPGRGRATAADPNAVNASTVQLVFLLLFSKLWQAAASLLLLPCQSATQLRGDRTARLCALQTLENSGYAMSSTNLRLVHADQCMGVAAVIPDTDGKGGGSGGGKKPHGGGDGGGHGGIKTFFLLVLVTGASRHTRC